MSGAAARNAERSFLLVLTLTLLSCGTASLIQALKLDYDFKHFYRDAVYVWQHHALNPDRHGPDRAQRRQLGFYLPAVPALLAPLGALAPVPAAIVWSATQTASLLVALLLLRRMVGPAAAALATILALPAAYEAARFNQLSLVLLAMLLAATTALERRRDVRAGVLIATAGVMKLLPLLLAWVLLVARRWRALAAFAASCAILIVVPPLLLFGPQRTWEYHHQWWHDNVEGAPAAGMTDPQLREHFIDHRNQSIPAVVARLTWPGHPYRAPFQPLRLSAQAARTLGRVLHAVAALAALGAMLWLARRSSLQVCMAFAMVAMTALAPLLRTYYLIWALPALALLAADSSSARTATRRAAGAGLIIWLAGMIGWISPSLRSLGVHLWMLIALGVCLCLTARQVSRPNWAR